MGQIPSKPNLNIVTRIKPSPGSSGTRLVRKNTIGVYDCNSHCLHFVKISPSMTVQEIKLQLPDSNLELVLGDYIIPNCATVAELGITERSLLKLCSDYKVSLHTSSTESSSIELDKIIGPHKTIKEPLLQPERFYRGFSEDDRLINVDLVRIAVPDISLCIHKSKHANALL